MCFGHHGNSEYGVALFFHEGRKPYIFATYGNDGVVCKIKACQVRFGIGIQAENLVASQFQFPDGPF